MTVPTVYIYCSSLARDAALEAQLEQRPAVFNEYHITFGELTDELARALPLDTPQPKVARAAFAREVSPGAGRLALLAHAARGAAPGELGPIAASARALEASGKLIFAWKGVQLRPDDLRAAAALLEAQPVCAGRAPLLRHLARLYELYEKALGADWTDREALERNLLARLKACRKIPARVLPPGAAVELVGFQRLAFFQQRVCRDLQRLGHRVRVIAPIFLDEKNDFEHTAAPLAQPGAARFEAPTPYAEVDAIGRRVRQWIVRDSVAPADIAVTFRDLGGYSQAVHDVFTRLHIPFYERRGEPAAFQPLVRVALSAIEACIAGLNRRALFRFLTAGPVDVAALAGESGTVDPQRLNELALDAGIEHFFGRAAADPARAWRARLESFLITLDLPGANSAALEARRKSARTLISLVARLAGLRARRSLASFARAWKSFYRWKNSASSAKERLALQELYAAFDDVAAAPHAESDAVELEEFFELLNGAILERSIPHEGVNRAGVQVLNFYDLRGLAFRRVALGGLSETLCPLQPGSDPILGARNESALRSALAKQLNDRSAADALHPRLAHETQAEERAIFTSACASATELISFSRPLRNFDGAALNASEFWGELAAPIEKLQADAPAPPLSACATASERELRGAWVLGGGLKASAPEKAAEESWARAEFQQSPRVRSLARAAALEQQQSRLFAQQALDNAREKNGESTAPEAPAAPDQITNRETFERIVRRLTPAGSGGPLLSPSDIENLARCPFKFFTEKICRFGQQDDPGEELSALDAGSLWHKIFSRFYARELEQAHALGLPVARLDHRNQAAYLKRLQFIAGEELVLTAQQSFTGHPGFWKLHEQRVETVLTSWLECELKNPHDGFHPALVEFEFGPEAGDRGARELTIPLGVLNADGTPAVLRVRGRMDRLDLKLEERAGKTTLIAVRVIDYKSGSSAGCKKKVKGESLNKLLDAQLPMYLAAAIAHLESFCGERNIAIDHDSVWQESRAGYYAVREAPQNARKKTPSLIEISDWPLGSAREFLKPGTEGGPALFELVRRAALSALRESFPVHPLACSGSNCPARQACRYVSMPVLEDDE